MSIRKFIGGAFVAMVLVSNGWLAGKISGEDQAKWLEEAGLTLDNIKFDLERSVENRWESKGNRMVWGNAAKRKIWIDGISKAFNAITKYISEMPGSGQGKMDPENQRRVTAAKDLILGKINTLFVNGLPTDAKKLNDDLVVGVLAINKQIEALKIIEGSIFAVNDDKKMTVIIKKFLSGVLDLLLQMYQQVYIVGKQQTEPAKKKK